MSVLWLLLGAVVLAVALFQLLCFTVALYEMLNLPETRHTRLRAGALGTALGGLVVETLGVVAFVLALPLGAFPWRRVPRLGPTDRPPLVFVPGWAMSRACFLLLRWRLRRDGWPHAIGLAYRTVHGSFADAAARLRDAVEALRARSGASHVILVAHSMGGIVCRLYLRELGGLARVAKLVTLGTPHQGSKLYALSLDPMVQDMRPGSAFLQRLAADDPVPASVDVTAIYPSFDYLVVPAALAYYPGAGNIEVEGVGHMGLLWSSRVYELVRENLEYAPAAEVASRGATGTRARER